MGIKIMQKDGNIIPLRDAVEELRNGLLEMQSQLEALEAMENKMKEAK